MPRGCQGAPARAVSAVLRHHGNRRVRLPSVPRHRKRIHQPDTLGRSRTQNGIAMKINWSAPKTTSYPLSSPRTSQPVSEVSRASLPPLLGERIEVRARRRTTEIVVSNEGLTISPHALTPVSSTGQALNLSRETGEATNETGSPMRGRYPRWAHTDSSYPLSSPRTPYPVSPHPDAGPVPTVGPYRVVVPSIVSPHSDAGPVPTVGCGGGYARHVQPQTGRRTPSSSPPAAQARPLRSDHESQSDGQTELGEKEKCASRY